MGVALRNTELALEAEIVVRDVVLDALPDAARRAEPWLHDPQPAADALRRAAGDGVDTAVAMRRIGSIRPRRSTLGIDVLNRALQIGARRRVAPADRRPRPPFVRVVIRNGLTLRRGSGGGGTLA